MLIESERRKAEFAGEVPIRLFDGVEWLFPAPKVRLRPSRGDDGRVTMRGLFTFGTDYDAKWNEFQSSAGFEQIGLLMGLAMDLLSRCYELTDVELADLLSYDRDSEAGTAMIEALAALVNGEAPKPSPGGTGSPST